MRSDQPVIKRDRLLTNQVPGLGLAVTMRGRPNYAYFIFGGYRRAEPMSPTYLLVRKQAKVVPASDHVLRLESRNRIRMAELTEEERLDPEDWESFLRISEGSLFRRSDHLWRKLHAADIEMLVRGRLFGFASLLHRRRRKR